MHLRASRSLFALALLAFPAASLAAGREPAQAVADYRQLLDWRYGPPRPLAAPVTIVIDTATFRLDTGTVRLMQPLAGGRVTGLVFEGAGRFTMTVPDRVERAQLQRFAQVTGLEQIDEPITQLVLRVSDRTIENAFGAAGTEFSECGLATARQSFWIEKLWDDVDSRIVAALGNPGTLAVAADVNTANFKWLTYRHNAVDQEEITLTHFARNMSEVWISLDRPEDRTPAGRPGEASPARASITHIDVKADLTRKGRIGPVGVSRQETINGHYVIEESLTPLADTAGALRLQLSSLAVNVKAFDEDGHEIAVLRDHIGARSIDIDNRYWDHGMTLLLASPLEKGKPRRLRFEYDLETANYAAGAGWYPTIPGQLHDRMTARLALKTRKKIEARAMGRLEGSTVDDSGKTSVWVVETPAKMLTFSTADSFEESRVEVPGIPPVVSFSPSFQVGIANKVRNVAADVANSLQFYQFLFDDRLDAKQVYVTAIAADHGQAFDGFLHMSEHTFMGEHPGASELFRAHEVAHEWWGHKIGWKTYRDQWLSEAFAEYSAMMFVDKFVKGGHEYFEEILQSYESMAKGNMKGGFSKFNRPWMVEVRDEFRGRLGPIGLGGRASTVEMPYGDILQTYVKGPLVLHMLRMLLSYQTGNDDLFVKILRDFAHEYGGREAGTMDFRRIVERDAPGDWGFFFDAWIDGAEIPTITSSYTVEPAEGKFKLTVKLERSGVSDDFWAPVPVAVECADGTKGVFIMGARDAVSAASIVLGSRPTSVVPGPDHSVLAVFKKN